MGMVDLIRPLGLLGKSQPHLKRLGHLPFNWLGLMIRFSRKDSHSLCVLSVCVS
jgi:hypothetical protein